MWPLVPWLENTNIVGSTWVFIIKYKEDGFFDRFKARLVAKGYTQVFGRDYYEMYSLVVRPTTIQLIIVLALSQNWTI